jgi:flagellar basal-body rod modification protein FlgD
MNAIEQIFGPSNSNSSSTNNDKELGQEDFLKLLVAQLKNQDPNNPADNGEFLGQIAQFSMVSGIDDLGVAFDGVAGSLYTNQAMQAAQLVGKDVLLEGNIASRTEGGPIEGFLDIADAATNIVLQIQDSSGSLVNVVELASASAGMQKFSWDGINEDGEQAPPGNYTITAQALIDGEQQALPVFVYSTVESVSVDRSNTSISLNLANSKSVGFPEVREYR